MFERVDRRGFFRRLAMVAAAAGSAPFILKTGQAQAQKAPKSSVQYQKTPKTVNGQTQKCSNCQFYVAGDGDMGKCQIVQGDVAAKGWCNLWAAK